MNIGTVAQATQYKQGHYNLILLSTNFPLILIKYPENEI